MKVSILARLIEVMLGMLTPEMLREFADAVLDWIEDRVLGTASKLDDAMVLPLCNLIRRTFDIPDND